MVFCHLRFLSFDFFFWPIGSEGQLHRNRSSGFWDIAIFFDFQNGCRLQSWIFKISKFYWLIGSTGPRCIIVLNFGKIGQYILHLSDFENENRMPSCMFKVKMFCLVVFGKPICIRKTNFIKIVLEVSKILPFFRFSRPPFWILKFWNFIGWLCPERREA